jgi:Ca2+:H+ antiporter
MLGICLFLAAYNKRIKKLNAAMADALSSLMIITTVALILPTALTSASNDNSKSPEFVHRNSDPPMISNFSRGSAIVLLVLYALYLYFQLGTHKHLFNDQNDETGTSEESQEPTHSVYIATIVLITSVVGIVACTYFFLDSVDLTNRFIAAILIPIASNAPEFSSVVAASRNGRINFAIGVIVGSILQIGLFVIPVLVALGWIIHKEMTLDFEVFQTTILFLAVFVVNRLLQDGQYTYVQGTMLVGL